MTARRVDKNQTMIVKRFRDHGLSVLIMSDLGKGAPDIAVGSSGMTFFIEIKNGDAPPSGQKLTPCELKFQDNWRGHYQIIKSIDEVDLFVISLKKKLKFMIDVI